VKKKITYIISDIDKVIAFEWIFTTLNKELFELSFILINSKNSSLKLFLQENSAKVYNIDCDSRKKIPFAIYKCCKLLKKIKPEIVHCHLFMASFIGLISAKLMSVKSRIYTRHHSDYHHVYFPKAVKFDKLINWLSTDIIAISYVVKKILIELEGVSNDKIHLIHHGFKLEDFYNSTYTFDKTLLSKYNPRLQSPVIGVISRQTEWKGIQFIIPAFKKFIKQYPDSLLIMANASGDYKSEIQQLLIGIPLRNYIEIEFENDIFSLYRLFDIYTHVPISYSLEAFGQTYVEALASDVPSVFTISGIANEFIVNEENALVVPYKDSDAIYEAWVRIYRDKDLSQKIVVKGKNDVAEKFQLKTMINKLEALYND
jgi:glycosyltransferase involved in cell wall biosynthesis